MTKAPAKKLFLFKECEDAIQKQRFDLVERLQKLEIMKSSFITPDEYLRKMIEFINYKKVTYGEDPVRKTKKKRDDSECPDDTDDI